jgi:TetR/AcrR family transcriptional regulator of autoinduction and epiphytic fitness
MMTAVSEERWRSLRRRRLVDAAAKVFAARGFEATSMDEIAHEAGAGKPTLYRYFAGKDALFEAVFVEALDTLEARLDIAEREASGHADKLLAMLRPIAATFREHVASLRTLSDSASGADRARRRILRERRGRIEARIAAILLRAQASGALRGDDPKLAARLIIGMVWSGTIGTDYDDESVAHAIVNLFIETDEARTRPHQLFRKTRVGDVMGARGGAR